MGYRDEYAETKAKCLARGMTANEWDGMQRDSNLTLRILGVLNAEQMRSIARRYGRFVS